MKEDIRVWLENLGLGKYGDAFVDNDVGTDVLAYLTKDDLEKLGVSLGNRLRLLKVIGADFAVAPQATTTMTTAAEPTEPTDVPSPTPQPGGEFEIQDPRGVAPAMYAPLLAFAMNGGQSVGASELISPKAGALIVCPAWLSHGVRPHTGAATRISIALNLSV